MSPAMPTCNLSIQLTSTKDGSEPSTEAVAVDATMSYLQCQEALCMQGIHNSLAVDSVSQEWPVWNDLDLFDEMDPTYMAIHEDLRLNSPIPSPASVFPMSTDDAHPSDLKKSLDLLLKEDSTDNFFD
jgi:hypothetical protein